MIGRMGEHIRSQWMGGLALFLVLTGGVAVAAFDPIGSDGDIDACFQRKSGDLDLLKGKRCDRNERAVSWSQAGPDTAQAILQKLGSVDGSGSGLDADTIDSLGSDAFVRTADSAGGDVGGPFSDLQIGAGRVGASEIANDSVGASDLASVLPTSSGVPVLLYAPIANGAAFTGTVDRDLQIIYVWSVATSPDGGTWTLRRGGVGGPAITNTVTVAASSGDVDRSTTLNAGAAQLFLLGTPTYTVEATGSLDAQVFALAMPEID